MQDQTASWFSRIILWHNKLVSQSDGG